MKSKVYLSALATVILGTLLHFTYQWSGRNPTVGIFSAVNESTWEHLKLLAIPMLFFLFPEYLLFGKNYSNYFPVRLLSILIGMSVIVTTFYTYTGILGTHCLWADIGTFLLGILASLWFSIKLLPTGYLTSKTAVRLSFFGIFLLILCFACFTFYPPELPLFQTPSSGSDIHAT